MSLRLDISGEYVFESANYITCIEPILHPDRILPYHDFLYIIDGTWEIREDENVYNLQTDDLIILAAGRHHFGTRVCSPNNRHMYIHAEETEASQCRQNRPVTLNTVIHCRNNPIIKQLFEAVIRASGNEEEMNRHRRKYLFGLLLCELYEQQQREAEGQTGVVENAAWLIRSNPQVFFEGKEMAERFFICQKTLNNQFRKTYGKTFYVYQMDLKLEMVKQYLQNYPDAGLAEAARNFGFCDEFHLGKVYKKKYGVSPKRHLRELREG